MYVKDLLKIKALHGAKLIAGENGINNEIHGINVLEAIDIENWGKQGEVILTSFFALQSLNDSELEVFFNKLNKIGISALIIKIERLLHQIPDKIIELCNKHFIPLVQIGKSIKYEAIILQVLEPIINRNEYLLSKYYEIHSEITSLALKMPSMDNILKEFKKLILRDVSLVNPVKSTEIGTNLDLHDIKVLGIKEISSERYMYFNYERIEVMYNGITPGIKGNQIRVRIPCLGFDDYELIIHELSKPISSEDFMVLENAVKFLQMELLKKYAISQNIFQQKNGIISDLLNGRLYEEKDVDEVLEALNISSHKNYQVVLVKLYQRDKNKIIDKSLMQPIIWNIKNTFKLNYKDMSYMERPERIAFIFNFKGVDNESNINSIKKIMQQMVMEDFFKEFYYCISISSVAEKLGIPRANKEVLDTQKVLRLFHKPNTMLSYEELGIYKLFLESNSLGNVDKFISPRLNKFRLDNPELFETLNVFLDTNQNYVLTSQKLFLHPKTVRYRIDKIKDILNTALVDPEEKLQIQISARLCRLLE